MVVRYGTEIAAGARESSRTSRGSGTPTLLPRCSRSRTVREARLELQRHRLSVLVDELRIARARSISATGSLIYSGMLPCLRFGVGSRFVSAVSSAETSIGSRPPRLDHLVDVAALGGVVGVREPFLVLGDQLLAARVGVGGLRELLAEDDVDGALRPHHRHLGGRPREVEVGADVLRAHHVVRPAVRLAEDHGQLRHGRLGVGVEQLGAVADDPAPLLLGSGKEAGHVDEGDERDVEGVAGPDEAGGLRGRVDVEHPGERLRLVPDDPDRVARQPCEAADDVLGEALLDLQELTVVDDLRDHLLDVVGLRRAVRDEGVELGRLAVGRIRRSGVHGRLEVVLGQEREQVARVLEHRLLVGRGQMRDAGLLGVRGRAAELLLRHLLARHRLHDVGAGDEHVRAALRHQDEVGDRRRVDGSAGARPEHERELRHDPGGLDVPPEDLRVAGERDDALLDPRSARVVDPDHRAAVLDGEIHHLADLLREDLGERAAEDGEVLAEDEDLAAEDRRRSRSRRRRRRAGSPSSRSRGSGGGRSGRARRRSRDRAASRPARPQAASPAPAGARPPSRSRRARPARSAPAARRASRRSCRGARPSPEPNGARTLVFLQHKLSENGLAWGSSSSLC